MEKSIFLCKVAKDNFLTIFYLCKSDKQKQKKKGKKRKKEETRERDRKIVCFFLKFLKKSIDKRFFLWYNIQAFGGIAQLARATGSYPVGHGFKSNSRYHRPVGQEVKTTPFHGVIMGSIPVRVTKRNKSELFRKSKLVRICFLLLMVRI